MSFASVISYVTQIFKINLITVVLLVKLVAKAGCGGLHKGDGGFWRDHAHTPPHHAKTKLLILTVEFLKLKIYALLSSYCETFCKSVFNHLATKAFNKHSNGRPLTSTQ